MNSITLVVVVLPPDPEPNLITHRVPSGQALPSPVFVAVISPKSSELPVVAIVLKEIVFTLE